MWGRWVSGVSFSITGRDGDEEDDARTCTKLVFLVLVRVLAMVLRGVVVRPRPGPRPRVSELVKLVDKEDDKFGAE